MEGFEIDNCLKSMEIVVDSREQPSERAERRCSAFLCPYYRAKLDYGDYTYNFTLPNGKKAFKKGNVAGHVVIERKESLAELSGNLFQNRDRFCREFDRAYENHAKIYLLVEDATWENIFNGKYRTKAHPNAYVASLLMFMARFDITPIFCKKETSGRIIKEILYRELKEKLEKGEYDV